MKDNFTTEYKIGNKTYVVTTQFNPSSAETVLDVFKGLVTLELEIVS